MLLRRYVISTVYVGFVLAVLPQPLSAQTITGAADAGRIIVQPELPYPSSDSDAPITPALKPQADIPKAAYDITFNLKDLKVEGSSVFGDGQLADIYQQDIGKTITLARIWQVAHEITLRYQQQGYFLTRAYVPAQSIENGVVHIHVTEGYIGEIALDDAYQNAITLELCDDIKASKPLSAKKLESFMLRLNDLPEAEFKATLEPLRGDDEGAIKLRILGKPRYSEASVKIDNYGSRYLGAYQSTARLKQSFIARHQTNIAASTSLPFDEMQYVGVSHDITLFPAWKFNVNGNYVQANPGYTLSLLDIKSRSLQLGAGISYQPIRQRTENLVWGAFLDGRKTRGDVFSNTPLTRDDVRTARISVDYDTDDAWGGYNFFDAKISKGLSLWGSSDKGDNNLSRAQANPNAAVFNASYLRQQPVGESVLVVGQVSGQVANSPLLSSEEFGYGGQRFGRAFDSSEITGDNGLNAMIELRYMRFSPWQNIQFVPYSFYDIGKVWNKDAGGADISASSVGIGVEISHENGFSSELGVALPLTRKAEAPQFGNGNAARVGFSLSYNW